MRLARIILKMRVHYPQKIKQNVCFLPENLDPLSNVNIGFVSALLLLTGVV